MWADTQLSFLMYYQTGNKGPRNHLEVARLEAKGSEGRNGLKRQSTLNADESNLPYYV